MRRGRTLRPGGWRLNEAKPQSAAFWGTASLCPSHLEGVFRQSLEVWCVQARTLRFGSCVADQGVGALGREFFGHATAKGKGLLWIGGGEFGVEPLFAVVAEYAAAERELIVFHACPAGDRCQASAVQGGEHGAFGGDGGMGLGVVQRRHG